MQFTIHYLNVFVLVGAPELNQCAEAVTLFLRLLDELGVPVAWEKFKGPSPKLTFLTRFASVGDPSPS